jgi:Domain of unknown function (DUF6438)
MKKLIFSVLALALTACSVVAPQPTPTPSPAPTPTPDYSSVQITLERTACFGFCPIYTLTIHGDGLVEYEGTEHVSVKGHQTTQLTQAQVAEVVAAFQQADYFNLKENYTASVTDIPSTITSFALNGRTKHITNYGGCMTDEPDQKAPQSLCDLETKIDTLVNTSQWIGQQP